MKDHHGNIVGREGHNLYSLSKGSTFCEIFVKMHEGSQHTRFSSVAYYSQCPVDSMTNEWKNV